MPSIDNPQALALPGPPTPSDERGRRLFGERACGAVNGADPWCQPLWGVVALALWLLGLVLGARAATVPSGFVESTVGSGWTDVVGLTFAADGRMYVWERVGRVWIIENGVKSATPFIDIHDEVGGWRDFGLLGFCLDPDFFNNGYVYLLYVVDHHHLVNAGTPNYDPGADEYYQATIGRVTRYTARASDGFRSVDPSSRRVLLGESMTTGPAILHESHGVGALLFGRDGTLLMSMGDGASYSSTDLGSASETYYEQGLNEGIIRPKENVGSYRAQMVDSLSGKVLRLDPVTGDGVPSNPFYDAARPRSAKSRVWALGLRNPSRMTLRPGTGSVNPADANPGVLYIGDVGWRTWEDLNVCTGPGQNFGWPAFEGLEVQSSYYNANLANQDAPNPLYGINGCAQRYFYFRDLIKQDTLGTPSWPNQCDPTQQVPASIPHFLHTRPALDWKHGQNVARTGIYSGTNAAVINVGASGSPVSGSVFPGNCSIGGVWYTHSSFPAEFQNTYFQADYGANWIKSFVFNSNHKPVAVQNFLSGGGGLVFVTMDPFTGDLLYITWSSTIRRVHYSLSSLPPTAVASANKNYGPAPLAVQFSSAGSIDPDGQALSYTWNFGDGTATSSAANPSHTFNAPAGVPTPYTVTLIVTDAGGLKATNSLLISVNNTPPQVTITSPTNGTRYSLSGDTVYPCTALVTDAEHPGAQLTCAWQTFLHHNDHEHSDPVDNRCSTSTTISPVGCDGETYYYRIVLTVADAAGLSGTSEVRLYPDCPKQMPVLTWNTPSPIVAGTPLGSLQLNATANVPGTFSYTPPAGTILPIGYGQTLSTVFTPADSDTYTNAGASVLIDVLLSGSLSNQTFVPWNSVWKYLDNGTDQGAAWRTTTFNDSAWASGPGQFGYGDGDEATVVNFGPNPGNRYITTYFRHAFSVSQAEAYTNIALQLLCDDGAVVYLNGLEVFRNNLPAGSIDYLTRASINIQGAGETTPVATTVDPAQLQEGANVLAAEIHQVRPNDTDLSFDLQLVGTTKAATAPNSLRLVWVRREAGSWITLRLEGAVGGSVVIEGSDDLDGWNTITILPNVDGTLTFQDTTGSSRPWRFYRALYTP